MSESSEERSQRTQRIERWLSIAVGVAAIVAVMVSLYQARLAREQLRASAWPYISQGNSFANGTPFRRFVTNDGIGPARVRSFRVIVDGHPVPTWNAAVRALTGEGDPGLVYSSVGRGTVLAPGASRTVLTLQPSPRTLRFVIALQTRLRTQVCYCSVYDECWNTDSEADEPSRVNSCSADTTAEFRQ